MVETKPLDNTVRQMAIYSRGHIILDIRRCHGYDSLNCIPLK